MEKTSSKSSSSHFSKLAFCFAEIAVVVPLLSGCAYTRIVLNGEQTTMPDHADVTPLRVVQCIIETHNETTGSRKEIVAPDVQSALEASKPLWFSTVREAQPVVVKLRTDSINSITDSGPDARFWLLEFLPAGSLCVIPAYFRRSVHLGLSIQLGPGEWSDAWTFRGRQDTVSFNPVTALIFSWFLCEDAGWIRAENSSQKSILVGAFDPSLFLGERNDKAGANPRFADMLANMIVDAWLTLSPSERRKAKNNPVARKLFKESGQQDCKTGEQESIGVPVPVPSGRIASFSPPSLVDSGFDASSRRGFVVFRRNDAESVAALGWARRTVIPKLTGNGRNVRILDESTIQDGVVRIEFEALPSAQTLVLSSEKPQIVSQSWNVETRRGFLVLDFSGCEDRAAALAWVRDEYLPDYCRTLGVAILADEPNAASMAPISILGLSTLSDNTVQVEFSID